MGQAVAPPAPLECPLTVSQTPEDDSADPRLSRPDGSALSPHLVPSPLAPAPRTRSPHPLCAPALLPCFSSALQMPSQWGLRLRARGAPAPAVTLPRGGTHGLSQQMNEFTDGLAMTTQPSALYESLKKLERRLP